MNCLRDKASAQVGSDVTLFSGSIGHCRIHTIAPGPLRAHNIIIINLGLI